MVSRVQKRAAIYRKLQLLRSFANFHRHSKTSVTLDASKYIEEQKKEVEKMNEDIIGMAQNSTIQNSLPMLRVEAQEKNFAIKVYTERSCRGLLVSILEAFETLALEVLQARVSCSDCFLLEAVAAKEDKGGDPIDEQVVKQVVLQAIQNWCEVN